MTMLRVPLRLPADIRDLVESARGDVGLNTYLLRAVERQLIRDGFLDANGSGNASFVVPPSSTSPPRRRRPPSAEGWRR